MTGPDDRATSRSITAALDRVYGDRAPDHGWQTVRRWDEGGDDPLDQILVYSHDGPVPHWLHEREPADWVVGLSLPQAEAIANQLLPRRGTDRLDLVPGVVFEVEPSIVHVDEGGVVTTIG
jgi:hypothetical protein